MSKTKLSSWILAVVIIITSVSIGYVIRFGILWWEGVLAVVLATIGIIIIGVVLLCYALGVSLSNYERSMRSVKGEMWGRQ